MFKILVWKAKHEDVYYNASTEEKELAAFKMVFDTMQEQGDYKCCPPKDGVERSLYLKAINSDLFATKKFIEMRKGYENEDVEIVTVYEPDSISKEAI